MHRFEKIPPEHCSEQTGPVQFSIPFIASALILDLLPALLHLLCFYLNMTLDYAQEYILTFLNLFSSATAIVSIPIFIGSFILRCRFLRHDPQPGASLIVTFPSFIISFLPLLISIGLLADLIGI